MQFARSRIMKGTPWDLRPAATARPEGPEPTITGPFTHMHRRLKKSSGTKVGDMVCCMLRQVEVDIYMSESDFVEGRLERKN